jgi:hypothetical protein
MYNKEGYDWAVKVSKGIAYFAVKTEAERCRKLWATGHFAQYASTSRLVSYDLGYAIQCRTAGDYFGPDGVPTMQARLNRM